MKRNVQFLLVGIIIGAVFFGGAVAYAAGILAQPKTATVIIDGEVVDIKGYLIEGNHYFQLRDLDAALIPGGKDFSIVWDNAKKHILIDTSRGYDPNEALPTATPTPTPEAMSIDEMKAEVVRLTNAERVKAGLPELEVLPALMKTAQDKAEDFLINNYYSHISPVHGDPNDIIKTAIPKAKSAGENLMGWTHSPKDAVDGWMRSSGHSANMLAKKFTHVGIGIVNTPSGYHYVLHFVGL